MKRNIIIIQLLMLVLALPVQAQNKNFRQDFEAFKNKAKKEYADFRKKALAEYAQFVREAWEEFGAEPPVEVPKEEKVMPMVTPEFEDETASWFTKLFGLDKKDPQKEAERKARKEAKEAEKKAKKEAKRRKRELTNDHLAVQQVVAAPAPAPKQPQPLAEVVPVPEKANDYMTFDVFGTQCRVRIGDNCRIHLNGLSGDELADAIGEFSKSQYDNMLYDCLQERKNHHFSDWAYYQMLLALTDKFYGKHTNEGTLVMGFLYSQSGYKMRYAHDNSKLYILVASQYNIFKKSFFYVDGECYYLLDNIGDDAKLAICKAKFPKESPLSLQITAVQDFTENPTLERTITSPRNPDFSFTLKSNKNYIDFYNTYPSSYTDNNFMTRWAMYANTPLEKGITAQLYPSMREKLDGMSPLEKVQQLDWWVQGTVDVKRENPDQGCFLYAFDDDVWGVDRAFFGEETFFYPYCDCEDRSILLSHLVRDLVNLDVILVYYPGHLAMAVNFQEDVPGDYIMVDGRKFTVCDPTYVGSDVGETMPTMKDKSTTVILLQRKG
ncbi:MAG: hypothetical protein IJ548_07780 [Paludibacteraceae bacterium]|nr:hypothetical protein [Paludibacteraceae bacterium]MBQ8713813.1 hypothetical protein [Prevotella sp.]